MLEQKLPHFCLIGANKTRKIVVEMIREVYYELQIVSSKKTLFYNAST